MNGEEKSGSPTGLSARSGVAIPPRCSNLTLLQPQVMSTYGAQRRTHGTRHTLAIKYPNKKHAIVLPRSKLEIMIAYSQFLLASLEGNFCMNLPYHVGIVHCVNRSGPYDLCCRNAVLSHSDIFVFNSNINCILITQMRLQCTYKLHAELQTRVEEASLLSKARVRN